MGIAHRQLIWDWNHDAPPPSTGCRTCPLPPPPFSTWAPSTPPTRSTPPA